VSTPQPIGLFYTHLDFSDTRLEEMEMPEDRVLEKLNSVSTAKRLANMVCNSLLIKGTAFTQRWVQELGDSNFGKREEIHKIKRLRRV
jgi:ATP-dependent RNA helicase DDX49/DBP8